MVSVLESYFGKITEESVKNNFVLIYELLDGMTPVCTVFHETLLHTYYLHVHVVGFLHVQCSCVQCLFTVCVCVFLQKSSTTVTPRKQTLAFSRHTSLRLE